MERLGILGLFGCSAACTSVYAIHLNRRGKASNALRAALTHEICLMVVGLGIISPGLSFLTTIGSRDPLWGASRLRPAPAMTERWLRPESMPERATVAECWIVG
jgi:hypothetical protein